MSADIAVDATEARRQRGLAIAALCKIEHRAGVWWVPSQHGNRKYVVRIDGERPHCSCPDFEERGQPCKHVFAALFVSRRERPLDGTVTTTESVTVSRQTIAERRTYKQNWPAYNAAQRNEKPKFQALLFDLCQGVEEPPQTVGRPRVLLRDAIFSAAFKVYSTVSGRRFMGDMQDAHAKGYVSRPVHYNSISKHLEMPGLAPVLRRLIAESSLPLRAIETEFAVDSSGFTTSRFVRWFDQKYGRPIRQCDWVKCHVTTGVKTNIVTAVEIGERSAADSPQFAPMVRATAQNFTIREVSADAAYSSYENHELVGTLGGTPFIAFRSTATAAQGGLFAKMFHYYSLRRDEFLASYHKRSNVESTFSMIKAKFGDHLRSKTDAAMANEALCKVLCHNICCLILSHYELGINARFWGQDPDPTDRAAGDAQANSDIDALAWV